MFVCRHEVHAGADDRVGDALPSVGGVEVSSRAVQDADFVLAETLCESLVDLGGDEAAVVHVLVVNTERSPIVVDVESADMVAVGMASEALSDAAVTRVINMCNVRPPIPTPGVPRVASASRGSVGRRSTASRALSHPGANW